MRWHLATVVLPLDRARAPHLGAAHGAHALRQHQLGGAVPAEGVAAAAEHIDVGARGHGGQAHRALHARLLLVCHARCLCLCHRVNTPTAAGPGAVTRIASCCCRRCRGAGPCITCHCMLLRRGHGVHYLLLLPLRWRRRLLGRGLQLGRLPHPAGHVAHAAGQRLRPRLEAVGLALQLVGCGRGRQMAGDRRRIGSDDAGGPSSCPCATCICTHRPAPPPNTPEAWPGSGGRRAAPASSASRSSCSAALSAAAASATCCSRSRRASAICGDARARGRWWVGGGGGGRQGAAAGSTTHTHS